MRAGFLFDDRLYGDLTPVRRDAIIIIDALAIGAVIEPVLLSAFERWCAFKLFLRQVDHIAIALFVIVQRFSG